MNPVGEYGNEYFLAHLGSGELGSGVRAVFFSSHW